MRCYWRLLHDYLKLKSIIINDNKTIYKEIKKSGWSCDKILSIFSHIDEDKKHHWITGIATR